MEEYVAAASRVGLWKQVHITIIVLWRGGPKIGEGVWYLEWFKKKEKKRKVIENVGKANTQGNNKMDVKSIAFFT